MSVTLLVGSQKQLADGLPWLRQFAEQMKLRADILVLGLDHRTLEAHCGKGLQSLWGERPSGGTPGKVALVDSDVEAVTRQISDWDSRLLLMIDDVDDDRFQASLFDRCGVKSVWLSSKGPPPTTAGQVFSMDDASMKATRWISRRLLGVEPGLQLDHVWVEAAFEKTEKAGDDDRLKTSGLVSRGLELERQRCDAGDLIWVAFGSRPSTENHYEVARALLSGASNASVALVSRKESWQQSLFAGVRYWASHVAEPMGREARLELAQSLEEGSEPNLEFLGLISAAAMLAAFGLLQNSAAVIIGAMLIAPLMTPIMGAGLSLAHGNRPLFQRSLLTIAFGFAGAFFSSFLFGWLVRLVHHPVVTDEMWGRCNPSPLDFCVGLVGGMAASYARTRSHLSSALAGAAIAAALVPPISTAGLQAAFNVWESTEKGWPVFGPLILVCVNVLTIMIGTSFVLYARGLRVESGHKWATRMTVSLVTLLLLVLVWMLHLETWLFG
ncbi:DUF389 domain-containing protein [Rhodopirellula halodulae]|uniref:DUF389 domain-containing protein n=1 Tax=Rhodopirellula halodulae TaxID=2894198 RepID=UPI001E4AA87B|nr:DUF389 domain-containing protein [Rhodopirellula sp. JC737]MCC9656504.1 DUF389 domain-containing protein [Rhodopirellula sp. JC737]